MSHIVQISGSPISFPCGDGETVLEAAIRAGYDIPWSCSKGLCGSCKGTLLQGSADDGGTSDALSAAEAEAGMRLLCRARPVTDVEIAVRSIAKRDPNARKQLTASIFRMHRAAADVTVLQLRFAAGRRVRFSAGQYLQVLLEDGSRRSYSMANRPQNNDGVELHVRHVPGGRFTAYLESEAAPGGKLQLELPFGEFGLRQPMDAPIVLVASGTGFAPFKSMLEELFARGPLQHDIRLYWGARKREDLYMAELPRKWMEKQPRFRFVPVLSDDSGERSGLVHHAVMEDFPSLAGHAVYACGVPAMVNAARRDFTSQRALPPEQFIADAFVVQGEPVPASTQQQSSP